jgi:hypothetical protein
MLAKAQLAATTSIAVKAGGATIGKVALAAQTAITTAARGAISAVAPMVALTAATAIRVFARAALYLFEPSPRFASVPAESRVASVPPNTVAGQSMAVIWPPKDPGEIADYDLDWVPGLGPLDTILSSAWVITSTDAPNATAIVMQSSSYLATRTKVWLSGGTLGFTYALQNTVTTANGDTLIRTAKVQIKKK